jgi:hypothetical protein
LIREAVNASDTQHAVLFCGSGATAGLAKIVGLLRLRRRDERGSESMTQPCPFPGCKRVFRDAGDMILHCYTHGDGARSALSGSGVLAAELEAQVGEAAVRR